MKKLVLLVAVLASVSLYSCNGGNESKPSVDSDSIKKAQTEQQDKQNQNNQDTTQNQQPSGEETPASK